MSGTAPRLSTTPTSLPAWGVRVEIQATGLPSRDRRHSPHGECGLKSAALAWIIATWARHSPHGECGLKSRSFAPIAIRPRHSPHGECGLKFGKSGTLEAAEASLPAWGVRVEMSSSSRSGASRPRHSPHGECGLKSDRTTRQARCGAHHSPHGECGLKFADVLDGYNRTHESLPAWGVRVEIASFRSSRSSSWSLPAWGVRVEIKRT